MSKAPYNNKRVYRKTIISKDEYDKVIEEASVAGIILNEDRFDFVRQILLSAKEYAATSIIENTIMDASKEVTISNVVKKIFGSLFLKKPSNSAQSKVTGTFNGLDEKQ